MEGMRYPSIPLAIFAGAMLCVAYSQHQAHLQFRKELAAFDKCMAKNSTDERNMKARTQGKLDEIDALFKLSPDSPGAFFGKHLVYSEQADWYLAHLSPCRVPIAP